jgi:hypothetical protein
MNHSSVYTKVAKKLFLHKFTSLCCSCILFFIDTVTEMFKNIYFSLSILKDEAKPVMAVSVIFT